jgi:hypothetical protein
MDKFLSFCIIGKRSSGLDNGMVIVSTKIERTLQVGAEDAFLSDPLYFMPDDYALPNVVVASSRRCGY